MNRRFGHPPDPRIKYRPRPGVYAVILAAGGVLMTFQDGVEREVQLPGGGIDPGESLLPALHREVLEETGYRIHRPVRLGMYHSFKYMPEYDLWAQKQCHIYLARIGRRMGPPSESGHSAMFLSWQDAAAHVASAGDAAFLRIAAARGFDQHR